MDNRPHKVTSKDEYDRVWACLSLAVGHLAPVAKDRLMGLYVEAKNWHLWRFGPLQAPIGVIGTETTEHSGIIRHIAVPGVHQHRGIGRLMVKTLKDLYPDVREWVAETDDDSVGFYRALGFSITPLGEKYPGRQRYSCRVVVP